MLRALVSSDSDVRDAFVTVLGLTKIEDTPRAIFYKKESWIFLFLQKTLSPEDVHWIASSFLPERVYFPYFGYSVDVVHEIGDVIVPNVFLPYRSEVGEVEITKENRDTLARDPRFLEIFEEQKDYYVEDFGLSIGGIVVDSAPSEPSDELMGKMMLAYEGDLYLREDITRALDAVVEDQIPSLILAGITRGKAHKKHASENPLILTARNIVTTIRLMEEE